VFQPHTTYGAQHRHREPSRWSAVDGPPRGYYGDISGRLLEAVTYNWLSDLELEEKSIAEELMINWQPRFGIATGFIIVIIRSSPRFAVPLGGYG